jgi:hypothetical protein
MTDAEILHTILQNVEWGELLGLSASDALQLAYSAGLLPSAHLPKKKGREMPPGKYPGSTPEKT